METLPIELHEQIFANLLTHVPRARRIESPASNESERRGVYNLRLTSHQLYEAGWQALLQIIEDVPTHCSVTGLRHLAALADLPHVSSKLTCLTLNTCKLICTSRANYEAQSIEARAIWLQDVLKDELVLIMRKLSHIRHVECAIQSISALGEGIGYERFFDVQMMVAAGPDPLHVCQL